MRIQLSCDGKNCPTNALPGIWVDAYEAEDFMKPCDHEMTITDIDTEIHGCDFGDDLSLITLENAADWESWLLSLDSSSFDFDLVEAYTNDIYSREISPDTEIIDEMEDRYQGEYDTPGEFAEHIVMETEALSDCPDYILNCVDWREVWERALRFDFEQIGDYYYFSKY